MQGFLVSKPLSSQDIVKILDTSCTLAPETNQGATKNQHGSAFEEETTPPKSKALCQPSQKLTATSDADELARLEALYRYQILDTDEEEIFDRIPRIVKNALGVSLSAIALIDADRRWFKAIAGGKRGSLPRQQSFCNYTIQSSEATIVPDTLLDENFRENVLVVGAPYIRAYLGVPLETAEGYRIGSLCCVDKEPRHFTDDQVQLVKDLSSIVMEQMEMRRLALFDPLTGARTRRGFRMDTDIRFKMAQLKKRPFSMLMLDIDHFKRINDRYGHKTGDEVLAEIGRRLLATISEEAVLGRIGGEEFAIALPDTALEGALRTAEQVRRAIDKTQFATSQDAIPVTVSIGTADADEFTSDLDELLEQADWALYEAKGQGRNRVAKFTPNAA